MEEIAGALVIFTGRHAYFFYFFTSDYVFY